MKNMDPWIHGSAAGAADGAAASVAAVLRWWVAADTMGDPGDENHVGACHEAVLRTTENALEPG